MKKSAKKKRGKKFSLKEEYSTAWKYLKDSRKFIYFTIGIFFAFALIGFFLSGLMDKIFLFLFGVGITEIIWEMIKKLLEETQGLSTIGMIGYILWNNAKTSFFGILFGILFGFFPFIIAVLNGYVLGFVSVLSVSSEGALSLWRLLPHGIFELPAIFISLAMGLKLGTWIFKKDKGKFLEENFSGILRVFLLIVIPLLVVAAVIEGVLLSL